MHTVGYIKLLKLISFVFYFIMWLLNVKLYKQFTLYFHWIALTVIAVYSKEKIWLGEGGWEFSLFVQWCEKINISIFINTKAIFCICLIYRTKCFSSSIANLSNGSVGRAQHSKTGKNWEKQNCGNDRDSRDHWGPLLHFVGDKCEILTL